jgi:CubicO group peptidase (beta-lactamase class C family)
LKLKYLAMAFAVMGQAVLGASANELDPGAGEWTPVERSNVAHQCGLDPALLDEADRKMGNIPYLVIRYGKLCHEHGDTTGVFGVNSITKLMGGLTVGIATTKTGLSDESPVSEYLNPWERGLINPKAKIAHVLAMTSTKWNLGYGKKGRWSYDALGTREINKLIPIVDRALAREPQAFPGVKSMGQLAKQELFDKIGMRSTNWSGKSIAYSMNSNVRDFARMGLLVMRKGMWGGQRIVSEEYIYRMSHPAFEDTNTGYGYLFMMNARKNWTYSSGSNDDACAPVSLWDSYPHRPFIEAPHCNGGNETCTQKYDAGTRWAAGFGGHKVVIHPGLDLVMAVRGDVSNEGHNKVWQAVRPALVKMDSTFGGDEGAFCKVYRNNEYAPDLR